MYNFCTKLLFWTPDGIRFHNGTFCTQSNIDTSIAIGWYEFERRDAVDKQLKRERICRALTAFWERPSPFRMKQTISVLFLDHTMLHLFFFIHCLTENNCGVIDFYVKLRYLILTNKFVSVNHPSFYYSIHALYGMMNNFNYKVRFKCSVHNFILHDVYQCRMFTVDAIHNFYRAIRDISLGNAHIYIIYLFTHNHFIYTYLIDLFPLMSNKRFVR